MITITKWFSFINCRLSLVKHSWQVMLHTVTFGKTALVFQEFKHKTVWLMKNTQYFRYIWKYADWSVVILRISITFLKYRHYICLFREDGQFFFFLTESLKLARRMSANIPALSLIFFVVISVSWHALKVSNFKISLWISSLFIFEKENGSLGCLLHTSAIASMLWWFVYCTAF